MAYYVTLLTLLNYLVFTHGFKMDAVVLQGNKQFIRIQNADEYVLECRFALGQGETVKAITWYHDDYNAFTWMPPDPPTVGKGLKEGDAVLTRKDGNLQFAQLHNDLAGNYRCEVMNSKGETYKSYDYQLLVIDMPHRDIITKSEVNDCKIKFSWEAPAIRPKPEIDCGFWSPDHKYILKATTWQATPYNNGSIAYHLDGEVFGISQMPLEAVMRCEIKIIKIDDSEIFLEQKIYNYTEVWERGCAPLEVGDGVDINYDNERLTCHAEIRSKNESAPVIAHIKCKDGFMPKYEDFVISVDMICKEKSWDVGGGLSWNHFDNLVCIEKPVVPEQAPPTQQSSEDHAGISHSRDPSSGVNGQISPTLFIVIGLGLLFAIAVGLKFNPRRKDERYTA